MINGSLGLLMLHKLIGVPFYTSQVIVELEHALNEDYTWFNDTTMRWLLNKEVNRGCPIP